MCPFHLINKAYPCFLPFLSAYVTNWHSLLPFKIHCIRSTSGILSTCSYSKNDGGVSNNLKKSSNDIVLIPLSIRFIESTERSALSASSSCVKFLCFRHNLTLSAIIYLISLIHLFSILIYF